MRRFSSLMILSCMALSVSACSNTGSSDGDATRLEGERISILDLQQGLATNLEATNTNVTIPTATTNEEWPQAGGYPHHAMQNLNVGTADTPLEKIWKARIGRGGSKAIPLNAKPVVAAGHIFTLDTSNKVRAFSV